MLEILVKTSYQTQITHPDDLTLDDPVSYGSGFMVHYKGVPFFITADHNIHLDDYSSEIPRRTGINYRTSIFTNFNPDIDTISTIVTPLDEFYSMTRFNLKKPQDAFELIDVAICILKEINFKYPFLTGEVRFKDFTVPAGEVKFSLREESFGVPSKDETYIIFGMVRPAMNGISLIRKGTVKENLKFIIKTGDYYLLNTPELITDYEDWAGLSGSPVFSSEGKCIGVLCSVNEDSNSVWVLPMDKIRFFMDHIIKLENLKLII